jgi:hypothetical protein
MQIAYTQDIRIMYIILIIKPAKRGFFKNVGIDGRIILKPISNRLEGVDWSHLAQYEVQLQSLVSMAMDLLVK